MIRSIIVVIRLIWIVSWHDMETKEAIFYQLSEISNELHLDPLTGELIELRKEADELLDMYLKIGEAVVCYEQIES